MQTLRIFSYCIIGTILEWYDFAIFGVLSPILAKIFFPHQDKTTGMLIAFSIFATGFIMRPVGGVILGHIGDRYGRKKAILLSMFLMTFATVGIGLLPTKGFDTHTLIFWLVMLRLFQGFSVGGEMAGVMTFISEISPQKRFFFYQSFIYSGTTGGMLLGTVVASLVFSSFDHNSYSNIWRIPFIFSFILGVVGLFLRLKAVETPVFSELLKQKKVLKIPVKELFFHFYKEVIFACLILSAGSSVIYYTVVYYPAFISQFQHHDTQYLHTATIGLLLLMCLVPCFGYFTHKRNIKTLIKLGLCCFILLPIPTLAWVSYHQQFLSVIIVQIIYVLIYSSFQALIPTLSALVFPNTVRFTGIAFCLNITTIFGGTFPMIALALVKFTGLSYAGSFYMTLMATVGLLSIVVVKNSIDLKHNEIT